MTLKKAQTAYDKLFKSATCQTVKGMITLHKMEGKVYFEFPIELFNKEMLLGSTIEETCDNGDGIVGQKPHYPLHIYFTKIDSAVQMRYVFNASITQPEDKNIQNAIQKSNIGAIIKNFPIKCWNNDKSAVIFDVTNFFISDMPTIDPFDPFGANTYFGWMQRITSFKPERSFIGDIKAFKDNVSISSHLSYEVSMRALGMFEYQTDKPFTAVLKRSLILLPKHPMRPRIYDPRIGIFYSGKMKFSNEDNGMQTIYYAHRWRLEPQDMEAYKQGKTVIPKKPIIFYIDPNFPPMWAKYIQMGVEDWNLAFEKIGFKNAIQTRPFPTNDPEFDPDNIKYNCIRYAPAPVQNAMGPSWVDPRTGEILNASVYVFHNLISLLHNWRMIQTAAVDHRVRTTKLPEDIMGDAIRYVVRHEIGHCFGLMHNMAASNAFPTDSLRSPKFTQKYGTTPSIMDYARFNYIAQPGDLEKGVKVTPPILGEYDYYAIRWNYQPIPEATTSEEEVTILNKWISEKANDPIYRYGKQQFRKHYDPTAFEEDLGNDAIKSATYGIKNLKYIMSNLNLWLDGEDQDYSFRNSIYISIINQYKTYIGHVNAIIGGIYLNEKYVGDPRPTYQAVTKSEQKRALQFMLKTQEDMAWIDNKEILKRIPIIGHPGALLQKNTLDKLIQNAPNLSLCIAKSEDPYTQEEYLSDIYNYIWKNTIKGKSLTDWEKDAQQTFVSSIIKSSGINSGKEGKNGQNNAIITELNIDEWIDLNMYHLFGYTPELTNMGRQTPTQIQGVGFQLPVKAKFPDITPIYYHFILKTKTQLERVKNTGDQATQAHYAYLLHKIQKAIEKN